MSRRVGAGGTRATGRDVAHFTGLSEPPSSQRRLPGERARGRTLTASGLRGSRHRVSWESLRGKRAQQGRRGFQREGAAHRWLSALGRLEPCRLLCSGGVGLGSGFKHEASRVQATGRRPSLKHAALSACLGPD